MRGCFGAVASRGAFFRFFALFWLLIGVETVPGVAGPFFTPLSQRESGALSSGLSGDLSVEEVWLRDQRNSKDAIIITEQWIFIIYSRREKKSYSLRHIHAICSENFETKNGQVVSFLNGFFYSREGWSSDSPLNVDGSTTPLLSGASLEGGFSLIAFARLCQANGGTYVLNETRKSANLFEKCIELKKNVFKSEVNGQNIVQTKQQPRSHFSITNLWITYFSFVVNSWRWKMSHKDSKNDDNFILQLSTICQHDSCSKTWLLRLNSLTSLRNFISNYFWGYTAFRMLAFLFFILPFGHVAGRPRRARSTQWPHKL